MITTEVGVSGNADLLAELDTRYVLKRADTLEIADTSYDLAAEALAKYVHMTNGSANTVSIRLDATEDLGDDFAAVIVWYGVGQTTISAVAGVTLNGVDGGGCTINARYQAVDVRKVGANAWHILGDHGTVS